MYYELDHDIQKDTKNMVSMKSNKDIMKENIIYRIREKFGKQVQSQPPSQINKVWDDIELL
jgi:hypothetical protein